MRLGKGVVKEFGLRVGTGQCGSGRKTGYVYRQLVLNSSGKVSDKDRTGEEQLAEMT